VSPKIWAIRSPTRDECDAFLDPLRKVIGELSTKQLGEAQPALEAFDKAKALIARRRRNSETIKCQVNTGLVALGLEPAYSTPKPARKRKPSSMRTTPPTPYSRGPSPCSPAWDW
jgi:hypothetical protein